MYPAFSQAAASWKSWSRFISGRSACALEQVTQIVQNAGAGKEGAAVASLPQRRRAWAMPFWIRRGCSGRR